jgi:hypothetical protein
MERQERPDGEGVRYNRDAAAELTGLFCWSP